jgi:hypothetical protein
MRGTSWDSVTVSDAESGVERPRSRCRADDCKRRSAVEAAELTRRGSTTEMLSLRCSSLMRWTRGMLRFLAMRTIVPH